MSPAAIDGIETADTLHNQPNCAVCKKAEVGDRKLLTCSRCKIIRYCSKDCQERHWPQHKTKCKAQNYILKIDLAPEDITDPSISRTLSCPAGATFDALHWALQVAFGWASTHTYDFKIKDPAAANEPAPDLANFTPQMIGKDNTHFAGLPAPDAGPRQNDLRIIEKNPRGIDAMHNRSRTHSQTPEVESKKIKLSKILEDQKYSDCEKEYEYDFGNCWIHRITVIGRDTSTEYFVCLDGEGHGVAEDVGSYKGWKELKEAYRTDHPDEKQRERRKWFENVASNRDLMGLGGGRERLFDREGINANLRH